MFIAFLQVIRSALWDAVMRLIHMIAEQTV